MMRGIALSFAGCLALVALVGCGRSMFETREPWRHDAEVECLKAGSVTEGPAVTRIDPIGGPGICGADFPLKVTALGESSTLGFADDPRPPGAIPHYPAGPPPAPRPSYGSVPQYSPRPAYGPNGEPGAPMPINPPGIEPPVGDPPGSYPAGRSSHGAVRPSYPPSPYEGSPQPPHSPPPQGRDAPYPAAPVTVPLAPSRGGLSSSPAAVAPTATLACPLVSALDHWMIDAVQPAALRWFGQPVAEIKQISAYSCRSMNGQRGAPISEHAFGNALDIAAFTLADGRRVTVKDGWRGLPEERGFLHDVHAAACQQFSTVLAPGSNAFHYDHIHVDLARRGSGRAICNPAPIPGNAVAGRRGDPAYTSSVDSRRTARARGFAPDSERAAGFDGGVRRAVPGED